MLRELREPADVAENHHRLIGLPKGHFLLLLRLQLLHNNARHIRCQGIEELHGSAQYEPQHLLDRGPQPACTNPKVKRVQNFLVYLQTLCKRGGGRSVVVGKMEDGEDGGVWCVRVPE